MAPPEIMGIFPMWLGFLSCMVMMNLYAKFIENNAPAAQSCQ
jgi:hypothetical protein